MTHFRPVNLVISSDEQLRAVLGALMELPPTESGQHLFHFMLPVADMVDKKSRYGFALAEVAVEVDDLLARLSVKSKGDFAHFECEAWLEELRNEARKGPPK